MNATRIKMMASASSHAVPLAALIAGTLAAVTVAAEPARAAVSIVSPESQRAVQLVVNKSTVVRVDRPVARALVGNADIADVVPMAGGAVYVLGKKSGSTSLTLYDGQQRLMAVIDVTVGPDVDAFQREIASALPMERIGVRASRDNLILTGTVSSAVAAQRASAIAETFAPKSVINMLALGGSQQVLLEVRFSEMRRSTVEQLGIRSMFSDNAGHFSASYGDAPATNNFGTIGGSFAIGGLNIAPSIDALEEKGLITTLARPNLMALSGEKASFLAGGEIPIPVAATIGTNGTPTITVDYKEYGVRLEFVPTVLEDGIVNLVVAPEVSEIDNGIAVRTGLISIPGLRTRRARTTVELRDGESFAVAGLLTSNHENNARQLPVLGNIPILGALFRSSLYQRGETELVIIITPHLVRPVAPNSVKLPTDIARPSTAAELFATGRTEQRLPAPAPAAPAASVPVKGADK
jgi:pilus assembly protein CpaC